MRARTYDLYYARKDGSCDTAMFGTTSHKRAIVKAAGFFLDNDLLKAKLYHVPVRQPTRLIWQRDGEEETGLGKGGVPCGEETRAEDAGAQLQHRCAGCD